MKKHKNNLLSIILIAVAIAIVLFGVISVWDGNTSGQAIARAPPRAVPVKVEPAIAPKPVVPAQKVIAAPKPVAGQPVKILPVANIPTQLVSPDANNNIDIRYDDETHACSGTIMNKGIKKEIVAPKAQDIDQCIFTVMQIYVTS